LKAVEWLCASCADVDRVSVEGDTPLIEVIDSCHEDIVQLLDRRAAVNAMEAGSWMPLRSASADRNDTMARPFLGRGAAANAADYDGETPLHVARSEGHLATAEVLLGVSVNAATEDGRTPLHEAVDEGWAQLARLLLSRRADANAGDGMGLTPLYMASHDGNPDLARLLLSHRASVHADAGGWAPLHVASGGGHGAVVDLLLENQAAVDVVRNAGWTRPCTLRVSKVIPPWLLRTTAARLCSRLPGAGSSRPWCCC